MNTNKPRPSGDPDEPNPSDDLHGCPACEYVWRRYGEQACHAHGRCD